MFLQMENFPHPIFQPVPAAARRVQTRPDSLGLGGLSTPSCGGCWRPPRVTARVSEWYLAVGNQKMESSCFMSDQKMRATQRRMKS